MRTKRESVHLLVTSEEHAELKRLAERDQVTLPRMILASVKLSHTPTGTSPYCECEGCLGPARWQVSSPGEPGYSWLECDPHSEESRRRNYLVRAVLRPTQADDSSVTTT